MEYFVNVLSCCRFYSCTGGYPGKLKRKQQNKITAYIDANTVYGTEVKRCNHLRSLKNGELKVGKHGLLIVRLFYYYNCLCLVNFKLTRILVSVILSVL